MKTIESDKLTILRPASDIFGFLTNFNNFRFLMPPQVVNWQSTEESCSFTIQGMTDLAMHISEKIPFSRIVILPDGHPPFDFQLDCSLDDSGTTTISQLIFHADLNPFLSMVAMNPLRNFVNLLNQKLKEIAENGFTIPS